jgi:hypothetical protein
MRNLLLVGVVAVTGIAFGAPASAQGVSIDTPVGGVTVGRDRGYYRYYDRRGYRAYGSDREYGRGECRTVTVERSDGSIKRIRKCGY